MVEVELLNVMTVVEEVECIVMIVMDVEWIVIIVMGVELRTVITVMVMEKLKVMKVKWNHVQNVMVEVIMIVMIVMVVVEYYLSAWVNESARTGQKYMTLKATPKAATAPAATTAPAQPRPGVVVADPIDDLPF